ncbi:MAG: polysaccharide biosynthesis/export family protein [Acidobacteria bacterium]|nr:polysaccharide biosynthesis/export family protein [Acidobacteriota bacterium]
MDLQRYRRDGLTLVIGIISLGLQAGLQAQNPSKGAAAPTAVEEVKSPNANATLDAAAPVDPKGYKLGPEDVIGVKVWREPELSGQFVVRPDGKITLPLSGDMPVEGKTLDDVKEMIRKAYSEQLNRPELTVSLLRVGSKKYFLVGEVNRTGMFPLIVPITVLEALNAAGGLREFANKKRITILRGTQRIKFNYDEVMKGKKLEQNIQIESGDQIYVP